MSPYPYLGQQVRFDEFFEPILINLQFVADLLPAQQHPL